MNGTNILGEVFISPLGPASLVGLLFMIDLYATLSRRLGEVTRTRPYYHRFWIGGAFIGLATFAQVLRTSAHISGRVTFPLSPEFGLLAFYLPLLIGVLVAILTAWRYWSWVLVGE